MKKLLTKCALLLLLCAALADSVTDTISVCIGYFGWTEDEYVEKAKFSWQALDDWYGSTLDTHEEFYSYTNGSGRTYLVYARGFYIRNLLDYAGVDVNSIASIDFFTKDHSNGAYRSFTKYALLDQPRYQYFKKGEQDVVATEFVTLDALLTDADVTFADGDSLSFVCDDGPYTKFNPTYKDITEGKYYFKDGKAEEVPAALALVWGVGAAADGTVADIAKTAKEAGLRFVCGTTEADFTEEKAAGKRMPSGVLELIVVSAAKAEEKPAEEKPAEETKTGFTDVLDTDWFKADVEKAVESKLMTGTSATTFNPKGVTTRAMVVATLYRLAGSPEVTEKAAFTDVASGSYYEAAVAWAARNEIASGTSATTFEPNKAVTREQLAKFLFNYAVYQGMDAVTLSENLSSFADHDTVSGYAVPAMQWAAGQGLINGTDGKLLPTGTATRCQFAAILNRFTASQSEKA